MQASLWEFALKFYGLPGVAPACLRCQDEAGADVTVLLFLLWQARAGCRLEVAAVEELDRLVADWRDHVVRPLRRVRRFLKSTDGAALPAVARLRERIKSAELIAERLELEVLSRHVQPVGQGAHRFLGQVAHANLAAYATATGCALPMDAIETLVAALAALPSGDETA